MSNKLSEQFLIDLGFQRIAIENFITRTNSPVEQWELNDLVLTIDADNDRLQPRVFNKQNPDFSLQFQTELQLKRILNHITNGKTLADILVMIQEERHREFTRMEELRKNKPYLEDYRYNDIGGSYFMLKTQPEQQIFMTYEKHATFAFHFTLNDIANLEHAKDTVQTGSQSHQAISFWYLTLESYINTLLKLCCVKMNKNFETYKNQNLQKRVSSLVGLLGIDIKQFNQRKIIAKLDEFSYFRNELFHDRHFGEEITFKHTAFSPIPIFSCQVDVIQSLLIVLEVASMLQYVITGIDNMATSILHNENVAIWEKIDVAYQKILQPYFAGVLNKHGIRTRLDFEWKEPEKFYSPVFQKGDIICNVRADQEPEFDFWLNQTRTNLGFTLYNGYLESFNYKPGTMKLNKVILD